MRTLLFLIFSTVASLSAQVILSRQIKGIRINGMDEARFPIALLDSHSVTIAFDVDGSKLENYRVKIYHCDRDWKITQSSFINDEYRNITRNLIPYETVPTGVKHYRWTYFLQIPGPQETQIANSLQITGMKDFEKLPYSGNYKFEVWSIDRNELAAEGKFVAVEKISDSLLTIDNRYLPSEISPMNQVNKAALSVSLPLPWIDQSASLYSYRMKTVDIYRNREIEMPHRVDIDDQNLNTYIEGYGTKDIRFIIDNLQPGNEYRRLDLRDIDFYPPEFMLRPRGGADLSRWLFQGAEDFHGTSTLVEGNRYADYVNYQFELMRTAGDSEEKIYIVGDFNGWNVDDQWRMQYDGAKKLYTLRTWLRRGAYDYQYVLNGNDWITLEGNDFRTVNVYTALLYYHDDRYGGFDRILLAAHRKSSGGMNATSQ